MATVLCEPCQSKNEERNAVHWCVDCEESMCTECTVHHRAMKATRNHHVVDRAKIPARETMQSHTCSNHNLQFEYFCIDHDSLGCKECLAQIHRRCDKVMSVDIAAKGAKSSQSFIDAVEFIEHVLETLKTFTKDREESIENINKDVKHVKDNITKAKREAIAYIESLEASLMKDINNKKTENVAKLKDDMAKAKQLEKHIVEKKKVFEFVGREGSDRQALLLAHTSKKTLAEVEEKASGLIKKAKIPSFQFNGNVKCDAISTLGSIAMEENPCPISFVPIKKRQSQIPVVTSHPALLIHECEFCPDGFIHGITFTDNNMMLLAYSDMEGYGDNRGILAYDENNEYQYRIHTEYKPWDMAMIPETNTAVMSSERDDYIQIVDVDRKKVVKTVEIRRSSRGGVAANKENLFVGSKGVIVVLDHKGHCMKKLKTEDGKFVISLALSSNNKIHYCTSMSNTVYCITSEGKEVFTYASPELKEPWGVTTDDRDNVYIIGFHSDNIHVLGPDGTFRYVKQQEEYTFMLSLCFNRDYTKLYIAHSDCNQISVFDLIK